MIIIGLLVVFSSTNLANSLAINIENLIPNQGKLYISLVDNKNSYDVLLKSRKSFLELSSFILKAEGIQVYDKVSKHIVLDQILDGFYALLLFQDLNGNKKLDVGLFGPKEPYGFSNNPEILFLPPSFEDVLFEIKSDQNITIRLIR